MPRVLGFLLVVAFVGLTGIQAAAAPSLVGKWTCQPLKAGELSDSSVVTITADGKISSKTSDGSVTATYTYAGGILTETVQGVELKSKVVWNGNDAFNLIVSDPDMTSRSCKRVP